MSYYSPEDIEAFFGQQESIPSKESLLNSIQHNSEIRAMLRGLSEHPGFEFLISNIRAQMFRRIAENLERPEGIDGIAKMTYVNGEIAGIKLALDFVSTIIDTCTTNIDTANKLSAAYYPDEQEQDNGQQSED